MSGPVDGLRALVRLLREVLATLGDLGGAIADPELRADALAAWHDLLRAAGAATVVDELPDVAATLA